jgi:hypothetical protein
MPAKAALYLPSTHLDLGTVLPGITSDADPLAGKLATYFEFQVSGHAVRLNVMPRSNLASHLLAFQRYLPKLEEDPFAIAEAEALIRKTEMVLGLVTTAEFDDSDSLGDTLYDIADAFSGFVFVYDSILLGDGRPVLGRLRHAK